MTQSAIATSQAAPEICFDGVDLSLGGLNILKDIDLEIRRGEFICVIGPSGCGKTTMLRLIAGFHRATAGAVMHEGRAVNGPSPDIAIVFQDYGKALLPWRNAADNVALALEAMRVPKSKRADMITGFLGKVGLANHAQKFPSQMSGGMQQRLQIARALAQNPSVLLMDEPFGALDAMTRQTLQDECLNLVENMGTTVFFVTHDIEEAIYLGDRVVTLSPNPGRIADIHTVNLPRPRNQLTTREDPEFLRLRRVLFDFIQGH